MEVYQLGVKLELQLLAYTTTQDPSGLPPTLQLTATLDP